MNAPPPRQRAILPAPMPSATSWQPKAWYLRTPRRAYAGNAHEPPAAPNTASRTVTVSLPPSPFPTEPSTTEAQAAIRDEFAFFGDWSERYQYLIDLGRKLPDLPAA